MDHFLAIFVTAGSEQEGAKIGRTLVEEGLVACANIVPHIRSVYRWKGQIREEGETLLIMKSREELFEKINHRIQELHSYEVPEIIALPVMAGSKPYLRWIEDNVKDIKE